MEAHAIYDCPEKLKVKRRRNDDVDHNNDVDDHNDNGVLDDDDARGDNRDGKFLYSCMYMYIYHTSTLPKLIYTYVCMYT